MRVPKFCNCGQPAILAGMDQPGSGSTLANGCARCRALEAAAEEIRRNNRGRRVDKAMPKTLHRLIAANCKAALARRGVSTFSNFQ